jgi:hypothetical protein
MKTTMLHLASLRNVLALACLGVVACAADAEPNGPLIASVEEPGAPVTPQPSQIHSQPTTPGDPLSAVGTGRAVPAAHDPAGFICRVGAFCEDFEEQGFVKRWGEVVSAGGGTIERIADSASIGSGSLRLLTRDESSTSYLLQQKGLLKGSWSGALGFAFRVDILPARYVGGPELTLSTADGPVTVRLAMTDEGVYVEQMSTAACQRDRCTPQRMRIATAHANHWYRVNLGFEVNPAAVAPYGRLEATIDDTGDVVSTDLSVPFYDGTMALSAGITQGDLGQRAVADLDDVSLLVR